MIDKVNAFLNGDALDPNTIVKVLDVIAKFDVEYGDKDHVVIVDNTRIDGMSVYNEIYRRMVVVETFGGSELGTLAWIVFKDKETGQHYKFTYEHESYNGFYYGCGEWTKVTPKQVMVTEYQYQK